MQLHRLRRRDFITLLGGAAAWPLAARAQLAAMPVIGLLGTESADLYADRLRMFRQGLRETGYVEGRNVAIEYRWAEGHYDRFPALLADLVSRKVAVIAAFAGTPPVLAAKAATTTIPIVFAIAGDPIALGLVASLARPGGNITGVSSLAVELGPKQLEVVNPDNPANANPLARAVETAAATRGIELHTLHARNESEFDRAFAALPNVGAGALMIGTDPFFNSHVEQLVALALRHRVPTIYPFREYAVAGGLLSYGDSIIGVYRVVGAYAGRIVGGEKPSDLPVQQSTKVELIVNLKTANALGFTVPLPLLVRADEVIE
jgi:putative tryptophan/tyrosine transport system substrate-binding protein